MNHRSPQFLKIAASPAQEEYAQAFAAFQALLGRMDVGQLASDSPATVDTPLVTTWLLV